MALAHLELAPFDSSQWVPALKAMSAATHGSVGQFFAWDWTGKVSDNQYSEAIDDSEWLAAGGADPRVNPYMRAASRMKPGDGFADWEIVTPEERRRHPIVGDIHDRYDVPHLCTYKLLQTRQTRLFFVSLRSASQGPIGAEDRAIFHRICSGATVAAHHALKVAYDGAALLAGAFGAMSVAAFVCDVFGRVIAKSEKAELLARSGNLLRLHSSAVQARNATATAALERAILFAARHQPGTAPDPHACVPLTDPRGQVAATAQAIPLPRDRCDIGLGAAALLIVNERPRNDPLLLASRFGFTKAESEVAGLLLQRMRIGELAERRQVSLETVRSQSKAIYSKAGVAGQRELVKRFGNS